MKIFRFVFAVAVVSFISAGPALGKAWRGLVPLHSTRTDVERLLGSPVSGRNIYQTATETISVTYAETQCAFGWKVPLNTVVSLMILPKSAIAFPDLRLDERRYEKRRNIDIPDVHYYVNQDEGINYSVDMARGLVTSIEHYAAATDNHLKCSTSTEATKPSKPVERVGTHPKVKGKRSRSGPTFVCSVHADVVSTTPGFCHRCGMRLISLLSTGKPIDASRAKVAPYPGGALSVEAPVTTITGGAALGSARERILEIEGFAPTYEYTCLMHPEIHEAQQGTCPKCGMPLATVNPSVRGEYKFLVAPEPQSPRPGEKVKLRFTISNPQTGERVENYVVNHEKLFHLFIVSQDLSEYQHIHPTLESDGTFLVETTLPRAGLYKLHADFFPVGGTPQIIHRDLVTAGFQPPKVPGLAALKPDPALVKIQDGMKIKLEPGGPLRAGTLIPLTYGLADAVSGKPVGDLEPYLGAWGHTLILNADQSEYLHTHPSAMLDNRADKTTLRGGPQVEFKAMFPAAGDYRIWTQFQRGGRVTTVFFTVRIQA